MSCTANPKQQRLDFKDRESTISRRATEITAEYKGWTFRTARAQHKREENTGDPFFNRLTQQPGSQCQAKPRATPPPHLWEGDVKGEAAEDPHAVFALPPHLLVQPCAPWGSRYKQSIGEVHVRCVQLCAVCM